MGRLITVESIRRRVRRVKVKTSDRKTLEFQLGILLEEFSHLSIEEISRWMDVSISVRKTYKRTA